jgi:hypothetical protein
MPVHEVEGGYRWGESGKVFADRADAEAQGRAAYANGFEEKLAGDAFDAPFQQAWGAPFPAPENEPWGPDTPTAESEDWRAQGDEFRLAGGCVHCGSTKGYEQSKGRPCADCGLPYFAGTISEIELIAFAEKFVDAGGRLEKHDDALRMTPPGYARATSALDRTMPVTGLIRRIAKLRAIVRKEDGPGDPMDWQGISLVIDRPKGFVQEGTGPDGVPWRRVYLYDYGYVPGTEGGDGEGLDVYVGGPNDPSGKAYWVAQRTFDGGFDEWKVFLGFPSAARARLAFRLHAPAELLGPVFEMPSGAMRSLLGVHPTTDDGRGLIESMGKAGEEGGAGEAGETAHEVAEAISELGEGARAGHEGHGEHGKGPKAHGEKKPKGEKKKPAEHASAGEKPTAEGHGEKKPAEEKPKGGGGGPERDEHGRFASKAFVAAKGYDPEQDRATNGEFGSGGGAPTGAKTEGTGHPAAPSSGSAESYFKEDKGRLSRLHDYTEHDYAAMNEFKRDPAAFATKHGEKEANKQEAKAAKFSADLRGAPKDPGTVSRGVMLPPAAIERMKPGGEVVARGFWSTTKDSGQAEGFAHQTAEGAQKKGDTRKPVVLHITQRSGVSLGKASTRPEEKEVILPHGTRLHVDKTEKKGGVLHVHMSEAA